MAKKPVCPLSVWKDEKGKQRKLKMHRCDRTCTMTQAECMELMQSQRFRIPTLRGYDPTIRRGYGPNRSIVETEERYYG